MHRAEFMALLHEYMMQNRGQRKGQAAFNLLYTYFPEQVDEVRGSHLDPFYNDGRLDPFLRHFGIS
jgi:hypothetical protein